jgi:glucosylceramidase
VSALKDFHSRHPDVPLAISECSGGDWSPNFASNLRYDVETLLINGIRNGASWVSKWNVALDPSGGPANGGCTNCRGVITIHPQAGTVSFNEAYYAFGHLGKFVTPGAQVVSSTTYGDTSIETVAFRNPDGSHVLLVLNAAQRSSRFAVSDRGRSFDATLAAGATATYTW